MSAYSNKVGNGFRWLANPYGFLDEALAQKGLTFRMALPGFGKALMTGDPRLIQEIIVSQHLVGGKGISVLRPILGDESLIMLHGPAHQSRRRLVSGPFRRHDTARYDECAVALTQEFVRKLPLDQPFSIYELARTVSLQIIIRLLFGEKSPAEARTIQALTEVFLSTFCSPLILFLKPLHLNLGRFTPWGRAILNRERLVRYIAAQIEWQRQSPCEDGSILAHIVQKSEAETLSVEQICAELLALLIFGHETGAAAIAWAFAHIYQRPDVLAGIKQEAFSGGEVQPYLEACINESMRLCPVVVQLIRVAEKDLVLANHAIKTGETVIPCTYLAHHNPDVFPRPERFVPERFMNGARYPYSFFPFGFGARTCIGKPFMLRQMPLIVSTIIQSTELALAPGYEPRPVRQMVLIVPKGGTLMVRRG